MAGSVALFTHCQAHQLSAMLNFVILVKECKHEYRTEFLGLKRGQNLCISHACTHKYLARLGINNVACSSSVSKALLLFE